MVGKIKRISTGEVLYDISGVWTQEIFIKGKVKKENRRSNGKIKVEVSSTSFHVHRTHRKNLFLMSSHILSYLNKLSP